MDKTNIVSQQEIRATDIQTLNDYLEEAFTLFSEKLLNATSGVLDGLGITSGGVSGFTVATGSIYQSGLFGVLEASSGMTVALPVSGTRTDLLVAYYAEVEDTSGTVMVLTDVDTRDQENQSLNQRKHGAVILQLLASTTYRN